MKANVAADLFGQTKKIRASGGCSLPTKEELKTPFEGEGTVAYCFCKGCCNLFEVTENGARELEKRAGVKSHISTNEFFIIGGCELCDSEDESVFIKEIE